MVAEDTSAIPGMTCCGIEDGDSLFRSPVTLYRILLVPVTSFGYAHIDAELCVHLEGSPSIKIKKGKNEREPMMPRRNSRRYLPTPSAYPLGDLFVVCVYRYTPRGMVVSKVRS